MYSDATLFTALEVLERMRKEKENYEAAYETIVLKPPPLSDIMTTAKWWESFQTYLG
jgi:hypothetical protein